MKLNRLGANDLSRSSNNLELGLPFPDKSRSRYCSSTPSVIQKRKHSWVPHDDKDLFYILAQKRLRRKSDYYHPLPSNSDLAENVSPPDYKCAFDRRKSNAIRRRIHPQLQRQALVNIPLQSSSSIYSKSSQPKKECKSKLQDLDQEHPKDPLRRLNAINFHELPPSLAKKNENKQENCFQSPDEKLSVKHLTLGQNYSWSPPSQSKELHVRPRLCSSHVPQLSNFSRSLRIKKWVAGMKLRNSAHESIEEIDKHPQITRAKKINRSISSESSIFEAKFAELPIESTYLSWSNQSEAEVKSLRLNALKDKLSSKGQPLTVLDLLEEQQPSEALKVAREGHTRVRMDVCLLWACMRANPQLVLLCLANGANPEARDTDGYSALHLAAESGCEEVVEILIQGGVRVCGPASWDNRGEATPIMLASKYGYADIVSMLLQRGANADAGLHTRSRTALHYAVRSGSTETVQVLINGGATINPLLLYSETPLHIAVEEGLSDVVDILLKAGADVRASRGHTKTTCLHISAQGSYYHITHQLLKAGADPNQEDSSGKTALHVATRSQCYDTVQILLSYKADPNVRDREGKTPLHTGIFKGSRNFECLKLLLEYKADPNISDNAGYTPLHLAALHDSSYCVKLYIKHGADMTQATKGGVTALNIILRRTPEVLTQIQENLNDAINFVEHDQQFEQDGQIQLDFRVLLSGKVGNPECRLLSCFIEEGQKSFIKHPLCETFLFLKWLRVRSFFIFNVLFYMLLVIALTQYFYLVFTGTSEYHHQLIANKSVPENETFHSDGISYSPRDNKTNQSLSSAQSIIYLNFEKDCLDLPPNLTIMRTVLLYFVWITLTFLTLKEGFQVLENPKNYLSSLDNILVWPVIVGSFLVTVNGYYRKAVCPWEYHIAALIILFSWLELLLLIGHFPAFGLYVHMFAQVTKNFGKFLFTYICLINAFSLSFGILFHNQSPFKHRFVRLLKTIVMMTGEIEYNEWFYESKWEERILYQGTSHLVFAMFLLFGTIVLMNLLVGLAVSDIQGLQKSAGLDRLVRQTYLIAHFESFMFGHWLSFFMPKKVLSIMHSRILLLNSMYGSIFLLNPKTFSNTSLPPDLIESIKRIARNRDHFSRRRNAFAEFRSLSNSLYPSGNSEDNISRGIDAIKCGLDVLVWQTEDHQDEMLKLRDKINTLNAFLLDLTKEKNEENNQKRTPFSEQESNFISCESDYSSKSSIHGSAATSGFD